MSANHCYSTMEQFGGKYSMFEVTMGSFDCAKVCELVGLYILKPAAHELLLCFKHGDICV